MKVTIDNAIFEGTAEEIYEVLSKLGYSIEKMSLLKSIEKEKQPTIVSWPYPNTLPLVPYWNKPYTVGDPPPGTYPIVTCGSGSAMCHNNTVIEDVSNSEDLDKWDV